MPLATLGQETRWAYSTTLPSPYEAFGGRRKKGQEREGWGKEAFPLTKIYHYTTRCDERKVAGERVWWMSVYLRRLWKGPRTQLWVTPQEDVYQEDRSVSHWTRKQRDDRYDLKPAENTATDTKPECEAGIASVQT